MFDQVFDSIRKSTEMTLQMQQEMLKKWLSLWPGLPSSQFPWGEQVKKFQKKWAAFSEETLKTQRETLESQLKAGLQNIENTFRLAEAKDAEELRAKTIELWQKVFDSLRQTYEAQVREIQATISRWTEIVTKGAA
jgi:hypothetical protein